MCNSRLFRCWTNQRKRSVARAVLLSATVLISGIELFASERRPVVLGSHSVSGAGAKCAEPLRMVEQALTTVDPLAPSEGAASPGNFESGFEAKEGYSLGPIHDQERWFAYGLAAGPEQPTVSNENPAGGAQHLRCDSDPNVPSDMFITASRDIERVGAGLCTFSVDVYISQVGGSLFQLAGHDAESGFAAWTVSFEPGDRGGDGVPGDIGVSSGESFALTAEEYVPGSHKRLRVESDDIQNTLKVFYDGVMIYNADYFRGSLALVYVLYDNTGGSTMDLDNLSVSCAGEPLVGACCLSDAGCVPNLTRVECNAMDRVAWLPETMCSATACDGACCLPNLSCFEDMTVTECAAADGEFSSYNYCYETSCGGACCIDETSCEENLRKSDCSDLGGVFEGRGTECATTECCGDDPDEDGVTGCSDVCPHAGGPGGVDIDGRPLGDVDGNCAVDLRDHAIMQLNFAGPPVP